MRFLTAILVAALMVVACIAYANGSTEGTAPTGAGTGATTPEATTPTTPETTTPETTTPETTTPEVVTPPVGTGPEVSPPATGTMTSIQMQSTPEVEALNTNLVVQNFGVDRASVMSLRQAGWSWGDINMFAQISSKTGQPLSTVAGWRAQGLSWADIGTKYNLAMADLTTPPVITTRVAGYTTEYGYEPIYYRTDIFGNPVLTKYEADRLARMGYDWKSIAIAANIAAEAGTTPASVLAWTDRGYTWPQIAREYGVDEKKVMNVSRYPFARGAGAPMGGTMETAPVGAGPSQPVMTQPIPPSSGTVPVY